MDGHTEIQAKYSNSSSLRGGVAQWVARLTPNVEIVGSSPIKSPRCFLEQETLPLLLNVSLSKKLYPCCLVLVGSRNGFERDFTIELK